MGLLQDVGDGIHRINEAIKALNDNPLVDHGIDWLGDYLMMHPFRKTATGARQVDQRWMRDEAPDLFAKTNLDENLFRQIFFSPSVSIGVRMILLHKWGPDPKLDLAVAAPDPSKGEIGPHQWADLRITLVEELFKPDSTNPAVGVALEGSEKDAKIAELGRFLTNLAKLTATDRMTELVKLHYCKPYETDYKAVKFQQFRHRFYMTAADYIRDLVDFINDTGPDGFAAFAQFAADKIDAGAVTTRRKLDDSAAWLNKQARDINLGTNSGRSRSFFGAHFRLPRLGRLIR